VKYARLALVHMKPSIKKSRRQQVVHQQEIGEPVPDDFMTPTKASEKYDRFRLLVYAPFVSKQKHAAMSNADKMIYHSLASYLAATASEDHPDAAADWDVTEFPYSHAWDCFQNSSVGVDPELFMVTNPGLSPGNQVEPEEGCNGAGNEACNINIDVAQADPVGKVYMQLAGLSGHSTCADAEYDDGSDDDYEGLDRDQLAALEELGKSFDWTAAAMELSREIRFGAHKWLKEQRNAAEGSLPKKSLPPHHFPECNGFQQLAAAIPVANFKLQMLVDECGTDMKKWVAHGIKDAAHLKEVLAPLDYNMVGAAGVGKTFTVATMETEMGKIADA